MNEHTVFARTDSGHAAVRDPHAPLPRSLRTLLISIDGKTNVGAYSRLLSNFGDVPALLESLLAGGYIASAGVKRASPGVAVAAASSPRSSSFRAGESAASAQRASEPRSTLLEPMATQPMASGGHAPAHDPYRPLVQNHLSGSRSAIHEQARLRTVRGLMSDFLFANLPQIAVEASLMIERLDTTEQVLRSLADYEKLVVRTGRKGLDHLKAVREALAY